MIPRLETGADLLCGTLEHLGVRHVFGVPGTQNVGLYEALRRSPIRSVLATHELAASFMANGYYRASGKVAPLVTIPGPGFTYALTGLAEALHDSAALLHIVGAPASHPDRRYAFQAIEQEKIAAPLAKRIYSVDRVDGISATVSEALRMALSGEPGPVLLEWTREALSSSPSREAAQAVPKIDPETSLADSCIEQASALLEAAKRPLLLVGQGAADAAELVQRLAERVGSPLFSTASGRGVLPEDHPLALGFDMVRSEVATLNEMIRRSDCVLALGCKLTSAGTGGYLLELPGDRLIRVDASEEVLRSNYPARLAVQGTVQGFLERLLPALERRPAVSDGGWTREEIGEWKNRLRIVPKASVPEPDVHGVTPPTAGAFFGALRSALPRNGIVVTDSGMHQGLVRRHFDVLAPRGLILPSDFQSMGFGLPAAIGARLAAPDRPVVAVIGDGGFSMSAMEMLTAIRERIPLTVVVFNDGKLNLIRLQQYATFGRSESVDLRNPDFCAFASAVGARYELVDGNAEEVLRTAISGDEVTIIEVLVGDSRPIRRMKGKSLARETARRILGPGLVRRIKAKTGSR